jgi:hypothetical protein
MPTALYSPSYGDPGKTQAHRTFQTIQGLGGRLGVAIQSPLGEGQESALADAILAGGGEVVLICWEHHHIPALAEAIPTLDRMPAIGFQPRHIRFIIGQLVAGRTRADTMLRASGIGPAQRLEPLLIVNVKTVVREANRLRG